MSISAVSLNLVNDLSQQQQNPFREVKQDFRQLASALQSGNLSEAQSSYSAIQQVLQANSGAGGSGLGTNTTLQNDFAALGQALQSGSLSQAQSAFAQLQSDGSPAAAQNNSLAAQPPIQDLYVPSTPTPTPAQQVQQDYSQLASALQTGNLTNAQSAFAGLEQVLQSQAGSNGTASSSSTTGSTNDPILNDLNTLGQALSSGSLTQAQSAFSQLQSDVQTAEQANATAQSTTPAATTQVEGHRHHRHHGGGGGFEAASSSATTNSTSTSTASEGVSVYG